jgi:hypothetical protein
VGEPFNQRKYKVAFALAEKALALAERVLGQEHPHTFINVNHLAGLYYVQRDWVCAAEFWRRSTTAIAKREQHGAPGRPSADGTEKSETGQLSWQFWRLVKVVYRLVDRPPARCEGLARDVSNSAMGAKLGGCGLLGADGGARRQENHRYLLATSCMVIAGRED